MKWMINYNQVWKKFNNEQNTTRRYYHGLWKLLDLLTPEDLTRIEPSPIMTPTIATSSLIVCITPSVHTIWNKVKNWKLLPEIPVSTREFVENFDNLFAIRKRGRFAVNPPPSLQPVQGPMVDQPQVFGQFDIVQVFSGYFHLCFRFSSKLQNCLWYWIQNIYWAKMQYNQWRTVLHWDWIWVHHRDQSSVQHRVRSSVQNFL